MAVRKVYFEENGVFKAGVSQLNTLAWNNKIGHQWGARRPRLSSNVFCQGVVVAFVLRRFSGGACVEAGMSGCLCFFVCIRFVGFP